MADVQHLCFEMTESLDANSAPGPKGKQSAGNLCEESPSSLARAGFSLVAEGLKKGTL